jgi:hypothetical protein
VNLCGVSRPSLSRECDYDEHQPEQGRGCRRNEEVEIRPSLQFIHNSVGRPSLPGSSLSYSGTKVGHTAEKLKVACCRNFKLTHYPELHTAPSGLARKD